MAPRKFSEVNWFDMPEFPYRSSRLLKALGNPKCISLISMLLEKEALSVSEIRLALDRSLNAVSVMLRALRDLEVVRYQRRGKEVLYALKHPGLIADLLNSAERYVRKAAAGEPDESGRMRGGNRA